MSEFLVNVMSIGLLNQIRHRSLRVLGENGEVVPESSELVSFKASDFLNVGELQEAIIRERRVDLAVEGGYLHDLVRLERDGLNEGKVYRSDADKLRLPIPQREIDADPNLAQNPGD